MAVSEGSPNGPRPRPPPWSKGRSPQSQSRGGGVAQRKGRVPRRSSAGFHASLPFRGVSMRRFHGTLALIMVAVSTAACAGRTASPQSPSGAEARARGEDEGMKPYAAVITSKAVTDDGLFDVH